MPKSVSMYFHSLTCQQCGVPFIGRKGQKYCSRKCADAAAHHRKPGIKKPDEKQLMRDRLAIRDAAYAAWEEANGIRPRIVESSGIITEIRGTSCVGHRTHT